MCQQGKGGNGPYELAYGISDSHIEVRNRHYWQRDAHVNANVIFNLKGEVHTRNA